MFLSACSCKDPKQQDEKAVDLHANPLHPVRYPGLYWHRLQLHLRQDGGAFLLVLTSCRGGGCNVLDAGGPASYCSSLGLAVTAPGSSLYKRAEILLRDREASDPIVSSASQPRTVCHEEKWDERGPSSSILHPRLTALSGDKMYCDIWHQSRAVTVGA